MRMKFTTIPIFEVADYGLVADGVEALEALRARLGTK